MPEGDSYRCVCNSGFQYIYNQNNIGICVDVNECQVGLHNCDVNAECQNEPGRFSCYCKPGFEGNCFFFTSRDTPEIKSWANYLEKVINYNYLIKTEIS